MKKELYLIEKENEKYAVVNIITNGSENLTLDNPQNLFVHSKTGLDVDIKNTKINKIKIEFPQEDEYKIFYKIYDINFNIESLLEINGNEQNLYYYMIINDINNMKDVDLYYQKKYINNYLGNISIKENNFLRLSNNFGNNKKIIEIQSDDKFLTINDKIILEFEEKNKYCNLCETIILNNGKYYEKIPLNLLINPIELIFPFDDEYNIELQEKEINKDFIKKIILLTILSNEDKIIYFNKIVDPKRIRITKSSTFKLNKENTIMWKEEIKSGENKFKFEYYYSNLKLM